MHGQPPNLIFVTSVIGVTSNSKEQGAGSEENDYQDATITCLRH